MREIKFRAWDKRTNQFGRTATLIEALEFAHNDPEAIGELDYLEFMQYTGLKDKQGKEIYEGDIVQYDGEYCKETAEVIWYGTGSWGLHEREKYLDELIFSQAIRYDSFSGKPIYTEIEVIGNIYENEELLK